MESSSCIPWLHRPLSWPCHGILLLLLKFDNWPSLISFVKRPLPNFSLPPLSSFEATASLILECGGLGEGGSWCLPGLFKYQQQHYFFFFLFFIFLYFLFCHCKCLSPHITGSHSLLVPPPTASSRSPSSARPPRWLLSFTVPEWFHSSLSPSLSMVNSSILSAATSKWVRI